MKTWAQQYRGFTIVELLIVIVVIAILAAISIVAYNGIQTRTNNTVTTQSVAQFIKAYGMYAVDKGEFPIGYSCLGEGYPSNRCLSQSGTAACFGIGASTATIINDALKPYMSNKVPSMSTQQIPCGGTTYIGAYAGSNAATPKSALVYMLLRGNQTCPDMSPNVTAVLKQYADDLTNCRYSLTTT